MTNIAQTILQQLGGNRFRVMTGAKDFVQNANALEFKFPKGRPGSGNLCQIVLTSDDLYTMRFYRFNKAKATVDEVKAFEHLYADSLQATFTEQTGLHTHL